MKLYKVRQCLENGIERTNSWEDLRKILELYMSRIKDELNKSRHKTRSDNYIKLWGFHIVNGTEVRLLIEEYQKEVCQVCPIGQRHIRCPKKQTCKLIELNKKLIYDILK